MVYLQPFSTTEIFCHRSAIRKTISGLLTDVDGRTKKELEAQRWRRRRVLVVIGKWPGRMYHDSMMNLSLRRWRVPVAVGFEADSNVS